MLIRLPNQDYWWVREGFPEGVKAGIEAEGRAGVGQSKEWKKNCETENGTLKDTAEVSVVEFQMDWKARGKQKRKKKVGRRYLK